MKNEDIVKHLIEIKEGQATQRTLLKELKADQKEHREEMHTVKEVQVTQGKELSKMKGAIKGVFALIGLIGVIAGLLKL